MKKLITVVILFLSLAVYSQNRYELLDEGKDKLFLSDAISKMADSGMITNHPIVVIDGKPYRFQDLENQKLSLWKNEIDKIVAIDRQTGINIYGNFGEAVSCLLLQTGRKKINAISYKLHLNK